MQLNQRDALMLALKAIAGAVVLYYFLAYSHGCSVDDSPLPWVRGGEQLDAGAGDTGRGHSRGDAGGNGVAELGELDQVDAGDAGELEQLDGGAHVDAGELDQVDAGDAGEQLEQLDAATHDAGELDAGTHVDAGQVDAGGAQCVAWCVSKGYPTGWLCLQSGKTTCCCQLKSAAP